MKKFIISLLNPAFSLEVLPSQARCPMPVASLLRDRFAASQNAGRGQVGNLLISTFIHERMTKLCELEVWLVWVLFAKIYRRCFWSLPLVANVHLWHRHFHDQVSWIGLPCLWRLRRMLAASRWLKPSPLWRREFHEVRSGLTGGWEFLPIKQTFVVIFCLRHI